MPQPRTKAKGTDKDAALAYTFWRARCFREGSPEEDFLRAVCANSINSKPAAVRSRMKGRASRPKGK